MVKRRVVRFQGYLYHNFVRLQVCDGQRLLREKTHPSFEGHDFQSTKQLVRDKHWRAEGWTLSSSAVKWEVCSQKQ